MSARIRRARVIVMGFMAAGTACHGDSAVSPSSTPAVTVQALTALQVGGTVEQAVLQTPRVVVKDLSGHPAAGITVEFFDPTGTVSISSMVTDATGIASPGQWIPGSKAGQSILFVRIAGRIQMRFTATVRPDVPASLRALSDTDNVEVSGEPITSLSIIVNDKFGNGVPSVDVWFWLYGAGVLSQPSTATDSSGVASLSVWTPDPRAGVSALVARVDGLDSIRFKARVLDSTTLVWYRLESIIANGKPLPTADEYVANAGLALSSDGYYVEDIAWTYSAATTHNGGRYTPSASNGSITFSKSGETAIIAGDSLLIGRMDPDFLSSVTWLYRLRTQ